MKIETTVRAQRSGTLRLYVQTGDTVSEGKLVCEVEDQQESEQIESEQSA